MGLLSNHTNGTNKRVTTAFLSGSASARPFSQPLLGRCGAGGKVCTRSRERTRSGEGGPEFTTNNQKGPSCPKEGAGKGGGVPPLFAQRMQRSICVMLADFSEVLGFGMVPSRNILRDSQSNQPGFHFVVRTDLVHPQYGMVARHTIMSQLQRTVDRTLHHFETIGNHNVCWNLQGNRTIPGF